MDSKYHNSPKNYNYTICSNSFLGLECTEGRSAGDCSGSGVLSSLITATAFALPGWLGVSGGLEIYSTLLPSPRLFPAI